MMLNLVPMKLLLTMPLFAGTHIFTQAHNLWEIMPTLDKALFIMRDLQNYIFSNVSGSLSLVSRVETVYVTVKHSV